MSIYIFDIDGTLADISHRLRFINQQQPPDWDAFFAACPDDLPIPEVIDVARALSNCGHTILLVSGRSDAVRAETSQWFKDFAPDFEYHGLYMRKAGDHRPDDIVKAELLERLAQDWDLKQVAGVFEDRQRVVDMYRSKGLRVFQVAEGNF